MGRTIALGTLAAGTLDILLAAILTLLRGGVPADMLRFVGSGPFPAAPEWGAAGAWIGHPFYVNGDDGCGFRPRRSPP